MMHEIKLTTEQLRIVNHVLYHVEQDFSRTIQRNMSINITDLRNIKQTRDKALAILKPLRQRETLDEIRRIFRRI